MQWWLKVVWNVANFDGRARRKEFWMFTLMNMLIGGGIGILLSLLHIVNSKSTMNTMVMVMFLSAIILTIAVAVRRLHDTGRSGWWLLLYPIPVVGFVVLVFWMLDGEVGENSYGPDPKEQDRKGENVGSVVKRVV